MHNQITALFIIIRWTKRKTCTDENSGTDEEIKIRKRSKWKGNWALETPTLNGCCFFLLTVTLYLPCESSNGKWHATTKFIFFFFTFGLLLWQFIDFRQISYGTQSTGIMKCISEWALWKSCRHKYSQKYLITAVILHFLSLHQPSATSHHQKHLSWFNTNLSFIFIQFLHHLHFIPY